MFRLVNRTAFKRAVLGLNSNGRSVTALRAFAHAKVDGRNPDLDQALVGLLKDRGLVANVTRYVINFFNYKLGTVKTDISVQ